VAIEYEEYDGEMTRASGGTRTPIDLEVDKPPIRVVMRGMAKQVTPPGTNADGVSYGEITNIKLVVMLPKKYEGEDDYNDEFVMSFSGSALPSQAISAFGDKTKLPEVWLNPELVNKEMLIQIVTDENDTRPERGLNKLRHLQYAGPFETERTDLPEEMALAGAYQRPGTADDDDTGPQYQL